MHLMPNRSIALAVAIAWLVAGCAILTTSSGTTIVSIDGPRGTLTIECRGEAPITGDACQGWGERVRRNPDAIDAVRIVLTDRTGVGGCLADFQGDAAMGFWGWPLEAPDQIERAAQDSINAIVFNSSTDVPSGSVGYARWFGSGTHTYKGETFYSIVEGDVVVKSGLSVPQKTFDEIVTHELGHTIGFRHSDQGTPSSTQAVMKAILTGNYGATLGPWDVEAVRHVYEQVGGSLTPPAVSFTDDPLQPGVTIIKAIHLIELRNAVNAWRTAAGLAPMAPAGLREPRRGRPARCSGGSPAMTTGGADATVPDETDRRCRCGCFGPRVRPAVRAGVER